MKDDGDMEKVAKVEVERCNCLLDTLKAELREETNELTCGGQSKRQQERFLGYWS